MPTNCKRKKPLMRLREKDPVQRMGQVTFYLLRVSWNPQFGFTRALNFNFAGSEYEDDLISLPCYVPPVADIWLDLYFASDTGDRGLSETTRMVCSYCNEYFSSSPNYLPSVSKRRQDSAWKASCRCSLGRKQRNYTMVVVVWSPVLTMLCLAHMQRAKPLEWELNDSIV